MKNDFIALAGKNGNNHWLLYVLGTLVSFIGGQFLGMIPLLLVVFKSGKLDIAMFTNPEALGVSKNEFLLLMLLPFVVSFFALLIWIKWVHKKQLRLSFTAFDRFRWNEVGFAFALWIAMSICSDGIGYFSDPGNYEFNFNLTNFLILSAISLLVIPLQTTFEELLFRSYLLQGIGLISSYRWIPLVITSVVFGGMHIMNPEVSEYGYSTMISYIGIGFLLGLLTVLSNRMEFAIGLHAANNIYGSTIMSFKGSALTTDSLFYTKTLSMDWTTHVLLLGIMMLYLFIIHRKYKLQGLSYLFERMSRE
jgi:membrane protease YdiL (CAAX protease family)